MSIRQNLVFLLILCMVGCASKTTKQPSTGNSDEVEVTDANEQPADFDWSFSDIHGRAHEPFTSDDTKGIVIVFVTTDCPIANYYQPTLSRLSDEFTARDVPFFLCHSDRNATLEEVTKHADEFKPTASVLLDSDQTIARHLDAKVTPEAFLIDRDGKTQYRGRINDLYADYGKRRSAPRTNDLRVAIESFLAGENIASPKTRAVGCYISYPKKEMNDHADN